MKGIPKSEDLSNVENKFDYGLNNLSIGLNWINNSKLEDSIHSNKIRDKYYI